MVVRRYNESIDSLLRRFKVESQESGILKSYMQKQFYLSPSQRRSEKHKSALKRQRKQQLRRNVV